MQQPKSYFLSPRTIDGAVLYRSRSSLRTYLYPASILRAATTICHRPVLRFTCHACHATLSVRWLKRGRRKRRMSARKITTITGIGIDRAGDTFCGKKMAIGKSGVSGLRLVRALEHRSSSGWKRILSLLLLVEGV